LPLSALKGYTPVFKTAVRSSKVKRQQLSIWHNYCARDKCRCIQIQGLFLIHYSWIGTGSRASYITFVYVYMCTFDWKVSAVWTCSCSVGCTERPAVHVNYIHMWLHYCTPIMTAEFSMIQ